MPSISRKTFSAPLIVNSDAGFGGPFSRSPGRPRPPYCTGTNSGLINLTSIGNYEIIHDKNNARVGNRIIKEL
jgi:hypothetical protein